MSDMSSPLSVAGSQISRGQFELVPYLSFVRLERASHTSSELPALASHTEILAHDKLYCLEKPFLRTLILSLKLNVAPFGLAAMNVVKLPFQGSQ